jgi:hypothetical protein
MFSMAQITPATKFVSLPQAQQLFGISRSFLYQLRGRGELKFHYVAAKPFIKISEFENLMKPETMEAGKNA